MGEATYYLKARFLEPTDALETDLHNFFIELQKAHEYWHSGGWKSEKEFWETFKKDYPLVSKFQKDLLDGGPGKLSGSMNVGYELQDVENGFAFDIAEGILYYTNYVWHFADWGKLCTFLEEEFGATATAWLSEEDANFFDLLKV
jgi:hypothetical protein